MTKPPLLAGALAAVLLAAGLGYAFWPSAQSEPEATGEAAGAPGTLSAEQVRALGIQLASAARASAIPLGTVPGTISLPPQARVAVTSPFAGVAVRVLVLEGEQVGRGQPLAVVRAAEPVQFGADLARAQADLAVERAQAERLAMLAREGVVAGARADQARAALQRTEATIAENRRLLAMAGAGRDGTATLRAPIAGRVAKVAVETGGAVGGEIAPFVVENTAALSIDLQLPERLAGQVRPGMAVSVPMAGSGEPAQGRILSVGSSLDPATRSISAKASLPAAPGFVPGQGVMAVIADAGATRREGISVPASAVTTIEGKDYVFVARREDRTTRFAMRAVTVVANAGGMAVLSSGLKPGEQVATSGVAELKSILGGA